jgi:hypothetical protein
MPKLEEIKLDSSPKEHTNQNSTSANPNNQTPPKSGLLTIIGNLLPLAPLAFEQFTGQKVPQLSGTMAEIQMALISIQTNLQTIVNNQNNLVNRIQQLEVNATHQLSNLTHQFNSLRLTHTREREKKEIEYNPPKLETEEY